MRRRKKTDTPIEDAPHLRSGDKEVERIQKQLELFNAVTFGRQDKDDFSNVIDLYDILPRYAQVQNVSDDEENLIRRVRHRGSEYVMEVAPARLGSGKNRRTVFPSQREEIIEHALRKLAIRGMGVVHGNQVSVRFRLNDLYRELEERGHTYSWAEIKEAILVCNSAKLTVSTADRRVEAMAPIFPVVVQARPDSPDPEDHYYWVTFYPLVTHAVLTLGYRRFDYGMHLSIRNYLARYLHQRLASLWIQASDSFPYTFGLNSMLSQTARGISPEMRNNIRAMKGALDTLIEKKIIREYTEKREKKGNRVLDIIYSLYPHEDFVAAMKGHNRHAQLIQSAGRDAIEMSPKD